MSPAIALNDILTDFGAPVRKPQAVQEPAAEPAVEVEPIVPPVPQFDFESEMEARQARLAERLEKEHAEALEAERHIHKQEMERFAAQYGEKAAALIVERLGVLETEISRMASQAVARMLAAILSDDLQKRSLDELQRVIRNALTDNEAVGIRIHGPLSLFEAVKPALGKRAEQIAYVESAGFDLTVTIDESIFQTRMAEWSEALTEVLK